ncbi:hypothetical protein [Cytobacillus purgationiresistens]|uniref:Uncharacterized protein n=1 Tax=Cytobacillus purgationiresistens TaxID=863449 RepID=A0ABU0AFB4_9BACI|nr:hypothetical protein [Cytobacillus purgationiresistens]MDQ0269935.1 hypothetical protein [Cytobacillus purgationiresistens]
MDAEAVFAHFALQRLRIRPREFFEMDRKEKAFVIASIQIRTEEEKKEASSINRKKK